MINTKTIVINLFGEPSAGKSTAAMDITSRLKRAGINAEYVSEFAKDKVYEENSEVFKHQEYIFGKQSFKMGRVREKVQVIVTDSPLILSAVYNQDEVLGKEFNTTVRNVFNSYDNRNYLLIRKHKYENEGRLHNEEQAVSIRKEIINTLKSMKVDFSVTTSSDEDCQNIVDKIVKEFLE